METRGTAIRGRGRSRRLQGKRLAPVARVPRRRGRGVSEDEYGAEAEENGERMNVSELKAKSVTELTEIAEELAVENAGGLRKQDLLYAILKAQTEKRGRVYAEGVLETLSDGFGFLRAPDQNYLEGPGRHLRFAFPDPSLQPPHRGYHLRSDPAAQGGRALLRPAQGRFDQLRGSPRRIVTRSCSTT